MWCTKPINAQFLGYYALTGLLWEVHTSLTITRELCFPKEQYVREVPSKPGINRYMINFVMNENSSSEANCLNNIQFV